MDVDRALVFYECKFLLFEFIESLSNEEKKETKKKKIVDDTNALNTMEEIFSDLLAEPSNQFEGFVGMSASDFELILSKVGPLIEKQKTRFRVHIPAKTRLAYIICSRCLTK